MNIGEKIAELRRDAGMTQEALASRLVISPQAVSKWERGIANPDLELIPEIARLFGISTDELLGLSSPKAQENELESRVSSLERLLAMLTEKDDHAMREIQLRDAPRVASFDFTKMTAEEKQKWKPDGLCILDDHQGAALVCKAIPAERAVGAAVDPQLIFAGLSVAINGPCTSSFTYAPRAAIPPAATTWRSTSPPRKIPNGITKNPRGAVASTATGSASTCSSTIRCSAAP